MRIVSNIAALGLVPAIGVAFAWWGVSALIGGNRLSGVTALLFAFAFFAFAVQWAVMRWSAQPRVDSDPAGTTIRPRRLFDALSLIWVGLATSGALLYTVLAPFGFLDIPTYRSSLPWMMAFILLAGVPTLWRMIAHGGDSYLRLTPNGCEVWNGQWLALRRASWNDIEQISDQPLRRKIRGREVIVLVLPEGRSATLLTDAITGDSLALREWVRFYWQNPECRAELIDGRALRRLDEHRFTID
jgi:hypothetical protein